MKPIFVYGTLQSAALRGAVAGGAPLEVQAARLDGYAVCPVLGNVVPLIRAEKGAVTAGAILSGMSPAQLARLDAYEGAFEYTLIDVDVHTAQGLVSAKMYLPPQGSAVTQVEWSLKVWTADHEAPAVLAATELFSYEPPLSHDEIRHRWKMIENRAWSKTRAASSLVPTNMHRRAAPSDVKILRQTAPMGRFFNFIGYEVDHLRFDGERSAVLPREVFIGTDAAIVLPYDVVRDRVLLVEQMRMGPVARHDPQPWSLEPIAGMVDARETPREAALRETAEEAGLVQIELRHVASFYPSPGSTTDYFHTYVGLCDLPDDHASHGGVADEAEDLRLHLVGFSEAMDLLRSGEIATGPLVSLLYWLALERDALRAGR